MTLLSWIILLVVSAVLATAAQFLFFRAGWIVGEVMLLGPFAITWQLPFFVWGLMIFGLAVSLWMTEYRGQHFPARQGSPA